MRAIVWRAEEFWEDSIKVATMPDGDPALEQRFEVPFSATGERLSGRIDKVVELDNELYVVDTKTTKTGLKITSSGNRAKGRENTGSGGNESFFEEVTKS